DSFLKRGVASRPLTASSIAEPIRDASCVGCCCGCGCAVAAGTLTTRAATVIAAVRYLRYRMARSPFGCVDAARVILRDARPLIGCWHFRETVTGHELSVQHVRRGSISLHLDLRRLQSCF